MAIAKQELTAVAVQEHYQVRYEKKSWLIFTWWVKVDSKSYGKDLVIQTAEQYDHIYVNDKEVK